MFLRQTGTEKGNKTNLISKLETFTQSTNTQKKNKKAGKIKKLP